jgi:hypothetical protein
MHFFFQVLHRQNRYVSKIPYLTMVCCLIDLDSSNSMPVYYHLQSLHPALQLYPEAKFFAYNNSNFY